MRERRGTMWCKLSRWMVSRAEDAGKKLPGFAERHVGRCGACGEFARSSLSLSSKLRDERSAWLAKVPDFSLRIEGEAGPAAAETRAAATVKPGSRRLLLGLRPLPVAAAALAALAGALALFQVVLREPAPSAEDRAAAWAAIRTLTSAPEGLQGIIGAAESSLEQERRILERSLSSAAEYLQARLNIKIERRGPTKTL
jgi:hypothetical protein